MRREQPAVEGLSAPALELLIALSHSTSPMRPGELGSDLQMTSPNVAAALRLLEKLGLAERQPDPHDKRKALVQLTSQGQTLIEESRASWRGWLRDTLDNVLTDAERKLLFTAGDLMQRLAEDDPRRVSIVNGQRGIAGRR